MQSPHDHQQYAIAIHSSVSAVGTHQWNALVTADDLPFLEWEWYAALELSQSISASSGWQAAHIVVRRDRQVVGIAPLYAKMHSWGELAFDHTWQHVAQQLGGEYFPKLVGMVPATPCSGYRFLISSSHDRRLLTTMILQTIEQMVEKWNIKTVAFNFVDFEWIQEIQEASAAEYHVWSHPGFSWHNRSFGSFDAYQQQFNKNQRRNIRRERAALGKNGLKGELLPATAVPHRYFHLMHRYYVATNEKFGPFAAHFLNRDFFDQIAQRYAHRIVFSCCFRYDELLLPYHRRTPVAMAMLIHKNDSLYGRYWGGVQEFRMAHFNVCYYIPIAWAIDHRHSYFDPGIGGEHKLRRGFEADTRHTLLRFTNPTMQKVLTDHHQEVNEATNDYINRLNQGRPIPSASDGA